MFENRELKKLGIEVTYKVQDTDVVEIANQVSSKLITTFQKSNLDFMNIYTILLSTNMYYANIKENISKANFYYKNSNIYFSKDIDIKNIDEYLFHECIHKIQEHKNKKNKLIRMGLCEINELSVKSMGLNEAAIQYITTKSLGLDEKFINIYNLNLFARSNYYPILTNLISQIAFLLGDDILVDSTINSNEEFKIEIIDNLGEKNYAYIEKSFDDILNEKNRVLNEDSINTATEKINNLYIKTMQTIYISYFNNLADRINTEIEADFSIQKLQDYKEFIKNNSGYEEFLEYFNIMQAKFENRKKEIKNNLALVVIKQNKILNIFRKLKKLFINPDNEYNK